MKHFSIRDFFASVMEMGIKHNHYKDFGYPESVSFEMLHRMYERNDLASAAVKKTTDKTFQTTPEVLRGSQEDTLVAEAFERLGFWDKMSDVDEYAQVSGYAGFVLRIADGKRFNEPVDGFSLDDLVEVIPAWSEQLKVSEWHTDESDADTYGKPKSFTFNESVVDTEKSSANRSIVVHPDRVFIWSADGTTKCRSALLSGYNNLLDMEKISGAGGEGFWKSAANRFNIQIDKDTDFAAFRAAVEKQSGKSFEDAMEEKTRKVNEGLDANFISQGMKVDTFAVSLPQPKEFFDIPLSAFAAGRGIPVKELIGNVTGERSSTQDAIAWNNTIKARRERWALPGVRRFLQFLESFGAIKSGWKISWADLADDTPAERLGRAKTMSDINKTQTEVDGQPVFGSDEIRTEAGHEGSAPPIPTFGENEDDQ